MAWFSWKRKRKRKRKGKGKPNKKKRTGWIISEIFEKTQPELKRLFNTCKYQLDSLNDTGDLSDQDYIKCLEKLNLLQIHTKQKESNSTTKNASIALLKSCTILSKNSLLYDTNDENNKENNEKESNEYND